MNDFLTIRKETDLITDGLGKYIDLEIKETVSNFRYLNLSTTGSCAGHLHRALPYPWIEFNTDSKKENERCFIIINDYLNKFTNEYLYIWMMGIFCGFRLQAIEAQNANHLLLLRKEIYNFSTDCLI